MSTERTFQVLDITCSAATQEVEVSIKKDGKVLWVNIDGICRLRVCRIPYLVIKDDRSRSITDNDAKVFEKTGSEGDLEFIGLIPMPTRKGFAPELVIELENGLKATYVIKADK